MGEWAWPFPIRYYGHNRGIHIPSLVKVPWDFRDGSPRRITSEPPSSNDSCVADGVEQKLKQLGYIDY
jgi:hypothetical protein